MEQHPITHIVACSNCDQRFKLSAQTYHGSGATWEMMMTTGSTEVQ